MELRSLKREVRARDVPFCKSEFWQALNLERNGTTCSFDFQSFTLGRQAFQDIQ